MTVEVGRVTQARVLRSEWIKMRSLRSTGFTLLAAVVAMVALGWIVGAATNAHWNEIDPRERLFFSPVDSSLAGYHLAQLAVCVLGVLLISGEYATGMVRATFAAVPRRLPVLWAKIALYAAVTFVLMLVAAFAAFIGGQHFLGSHGTTLSAPHAVRGIVGVAGYLTLISVLAVAFGFVIRSTAGAIASLVGLLLVLPGIGQVLPQSWQRHTLPYLPSNAGASVFSVNTDAGMLGAGEGLVVTLIWVLLAVALAAAVLRRRDV